MDLIEKMSIKRYDKNTFFKFVIIYIVRLYSRRRYSYKLIFVWNFQRYWHIEVLIYFDVLNLQTSTWWVFFYNFIVLHLIWQNGQIHTSWRYEYFKVNYCKNKQSLDNHSQSVDFDICRWDIDAYFVSLKDFRSLTLSWF